MPPILHAAQDLHPRRRTDGGQRRLGIRLGVIKVDRAPRPVDIAGPGLADQQARGQDVLLIGFTAVEGRADLKQGQIGETARLVAGSSLQEPRQQSGPQVAHL